MDSRDGLRAHLSGSGCTGCGAAIHADGIVVLADRGDLAYVELRCAACGSATLGVVVAQPGRAAVLDVAGHPELLPSDEARLAGRPPIDAADAARMRRFLAGWDGDLRSLLDDPGAAGSGPS